MPRRASATSRLEDTAVETNWQQDEPWDPMHYGHPRMALEDRAKIFAPFDPLKGFRKELRRRELLNEQRQQHDPWLPEDDLPSEEPLVD